LSSEAEVVSSETVSSEAAGVLSATALPEVEGLSSANVFPKAEVVTSETVPSEAEVVSSETVPSEAEGLLSATVSSEGEGVLSATVSSEGEVVSSVVDQCTKAELEGSVFIFDWQQGQTKIRSGREMVSMFDFTYPEGVQECSCETAIYPYFSGGTDPRPWWAMFLVNTDNRVAMNHQVNNAATSLLRRTCVDIDAEALRSAVPADQEDLVTAALNGGLVGSFTLMFSEEGFQRGLEDWVEQGFTPAGGIDVQAMSIYTALATGVGGLEGIKAMTVWLAAINDVGRPGSNVVSRAESLTLAHEHVRARAEMNKRSPEAEQKSYKPRGLAFFSSTSYSVSPSSYTNVFDTTNTYLIRGLNELATSFLTSELMQRTLRAAFNNGPVTSVCDLADLIERAGYEVEPVFPEPVTKRNGQRKGKSDGSLLGWLMGRHRQAPLSNAAPRGRSSGSGAATRHLPRKWSPPRMLPQVVSDQCGIPTPPTPAPTALIPGTCPMKNELQAGAYNLLICGDMDAPSSTGDIEGTLAVLGNFAIGNGFSIGASVPCAEDGSTAGYGLAAGGNVQWGNGRLQCQPNAGNTFLEWRLGGQSQTTVLQPGQGEDEVPGFQNEIQVECDARVQQCSEWSDVDFLKTTYGDCNIVEAVGGPIGPAEWQQNQLQFPVDEDAFLNFITVEAKFLTSTVNTMSYFTKSGRGDLKDTYVIVNIVGETPDTPVYFQGGIFVDSDTFQMGDDASRVLWTKCGDEDVVMRFIGWMGSFLAPTSAFDIGSSGQFNGQGVFASYSGDRPNQALVEFHFNSYFDCPLPSDAPACPQRLHLLGRSDLPPASSSPSGDGGRFLSWLSSWEAGGGGRSRRSLLQDTCIPLLDTVKRPEVQGDVVVEGVLAVVGAAAPEITKAFKKSISESLGIEPDRVHVPMAMLVGRDLTVFVAVETDCNFCKDPGLDPHMANLTSTCQYEGIAAVEPGLVIPWQILDLENARTCMDCTCVG